MKSLIICFNCKKVVDKDLSLASEPDEDGNCKGICHKCVDKHRDIIKFFYDNPEMEQRLG
jgi:hypothetical protein